MKKEKKQGIPPLWKYILQVVLIVWFGYTFIMMATIIFDEATDDYRGDKSLQSNMNSGDYVGVFDYYYVLKSLGQVDGDVFDKYREFAEFYQFFNSHVQYTISYHNLGEEKYRIKANEYREKMKDIMTNSEYYDNLSHYEYLLESDVIIDKGKGGW